MGATLVIYTTLVGYFRSWVANLIIFQRSKDLIRFICVRFEMKSGNLSLWYKQPGKFMVELTPSFNSITPYKYNLLPGTVALGKFPVAR